MVKICPKNITPIDASECIGNTREKLNSNFKSLAASICTATDAISAINADLDFLPPIGTIIRYWGDIAAPGDNFDFLGRGRLPTRDGQNLFCWALCNGKNSTPDLRDRFIVAAGGNYNQSYPGGNRGPLLNSTISLSFSSWQLSTPELPIHNHTIIDGNYKGIPNNGHNHTITDPKHDHGYTDIADSSSSRAMDADCKYISWWYGLGILPILFPVPNCVNWKHTAAKKGRQTDTRKTGIPEGTKESSQLPPTTERSTTGVVSLSTGESIPHENRPPYHALGFIMRIS